MAKKPAKKKPQQPKESNLKPLIREFLLDGCLLKEDIKNPNLDFGFKFLYPPTPNGRPFSVAKPKKKDFIDITHGLHLAPNHSEAFDQLEGEKKNEFITKLLNIVHYKGLICDLRFKKEKKVYIIADRIYIEDKAKISINKFYKTIRMIFGTASFSVTFINEFLLGKFEPGDITSGPSFYT